MLVVGCAGITNTMLASVRERIREIGILMSLGANDVHLYKIFITQSLILGLVGGLIGCLLGLVSSLVIGPLFMEATVGFLEMPLFIIPLCIALSMMVSMGASVYPAWRASRIDPVQALRTT